MTRLTLLPVLDADAMFCAARHALKRLGFVSMLLLALVVAMPATQAQAQACEPGRERSSVVALVDAADGCAINGCQDCGLACADGCCHAPTVGVLSGAVVGMATFRFESPAGWADVLGAPSGERSGLKRPPRA